MQVYFRGLDVLFFRSVKEVWVSKQQSRPTNTKSAGYKFFQIRAGFKGFIFTRLKDVGVSQGAGDEKGEKCGREAERQSERWSER